MEGNLPFVVVGIGIAIAFVTDFFRFKVYNSLTFPVFFGGLAYGAVNGGWPGLGFALAGAFAGFGILLIPYLMGLPQPLSSTAFLPRGPNVLLTALDSFSTPVKRAFRASTSNVKSFEAISLLSPVRSA